MYRLAKVQSAEEWRRLHAIRREVLFDTGVFPFVYDENRPEDRMDGNTPYLLMLSDNAIGVARLDRHGRAGVVRMVGICTAEQRQGHGRALSDLLDVEARSQGISELCVNAYKHAIGFYERTGWRPHVWDVDELRRLEPGNVQMIKKLSEVSPLA